MWRLRTVGMAFPGYEELPRPHQVKSGGGDPPGLPLRDVDGALTGRAAPIPGHRVVRLRQGQRGKEPVWAETDEAAPPASRT